MTDAEKMELENLQMRERQLGKEMRDLGLQVARLTRLIIELVADRYDIQ